MQDLLCVKNLSAGYNNIPIIHDISFSIAPHEILGVVGESGSGKTTLLKAIAQIKGLNTEIYQGEILFENKNIGDISPEEKRKMLGDKLAFVFQNSSTSLHPTRRIIDQFYEMAQAHTSLNKTEVQDLALEIFSNMGLHDGKRIMKAYPFELSGGMAQRVSIALAVLLRPQLILADESTSALDATVQKQVIEELLLLRKKFGTAMLVITHNVGVVGKMADKIAVMYKGRIVEYGNTSEVLNNPQHDYTRALLAAVPKLNKPFELEKMKNSEDHNDSGCSCLDKCCCEYHHYLQDITQEHYRDCRKEHL